KADAGIASPLVRAFIDAPPAVGDEIAPADEEGEVESVAVPVQFGSEVGELLPAFELGAIVERHDDELRRAIDAPPRRRTRAQRNERRPCGAQASRRPISPPTPKATQSP